MKKNIYIANQSKQKLGGGFTFIDNFVKGSQQICKFVDKWQDAHIVFIPSSSMTVTDEIYEAKKNKKKIVFRVDNMPKNSRNRNTGSSRMEAFARVADVIIFQSDWAKRYVGKWLEVTHKININNSPVIYNGIDPEFFYYKDDPRQRGETYLFATYNTDENKRFSEAAYDFYNRNLHASTGEYPKPKLTLVGNFAKELLEYKFDFFNNEDVTYVPVISEKSKMGDIYRKNRYLYFPAFADASPNTVGEAIACGCEVLLPNSTGGTIETIELYKNRTYTIYDMFKDYFRYF